jgi:hypothetical protein
MIKFNKFLFPLYAYRQYKELWDRLFNMEDALNWVINSPGYEASDDTGFNGQHFRKQIFEELVNTCHFDAILETGTYTGNTTGYLAKTSNLPVYTSELNKWYYDIAQMRLKEFTNIHYSFGDSRKFLRKLAQNEVGKKNVFIYLDAHWYSDLPLQEELNIIGGHWDNFVIMIDDFQVPDDPGYDYDYYTRRKSLRMKVFGKVFAEHNLESFFPTAPSEQETGNKRGCVVLAPKGKWSNQLEKLESLRKIK